MSRKLLVLILGFALSEHFLTFGCLITNCPRGGKRSGKMALAEDAIKPCISCGPGRVGQCFGPNICCGPFGCLIGTPETSICRREGLFMDKQPCIAGNASCRKESGRCASDGICCGQDFCYTDKTCLYEDGKVSRTAPFDLYNFLNYQNQDLILDK